MARRRPNAGVLAHSDRGGQYASDHYQSLLADAGITCSVCGVGQCWDNATLESFFGGLKCELSPGVLFASREHAQAEFFEYLEVFYNRVRLHSLLGTFPLSSLSGRITKNTVNSVSIFPGENQC